MSDIGATLREAREQQGISIAAAEQGTHIRSRFLEALENNQWDTLQGDVYVRGFLRNYASFLGLDPAPLLAQLAPSQMAVRFPLTPTGAAPRLLNEPLQGSPLPVARILFTLGVLLLLGVLALTLWWEPTQRDAFFERAGISLPQRAAQASATIPLVVEVGGAAIDSTDPITQTQVVTQTVVIIEPNRTATPVPTATLPPRTPTPDPQAVAAEPQEPTPTATVTAGVAQGIVLTAQVLERSWTEVYIDGQSEAVVFRTLEPGETYEWIAEEEIYLRAGNAAGISLALNGEDLGVLGRTGGLSTRRWQRNPDGGAPLLAESEDR